MVLIGPSCWVATRRRRSAANWLPPLPDPRASDRDRPNSRRSCPTSSAGPSRVQQSFNSSRCSQRLAFQTFQFFYCFLRPNVVFCLFGFGNSTYSKWLESNHLKVVCKPTTERLISYTENWKLSYLLKKFVVTLNESLFGLTIYLNFGIRRNKLRYTQISSFRFASSRTVNYINVNTQD